MSYLTEKNFSLGILKKSYSCVNNITNDKKKKKIAAFSEHYEVKN